MTDAVKLKQIIEGLLLASGKPLSLEQIAAIFSDDERPETAEIRSAIASIEEENPARGFELVKVASGYRFQVKQNLAEWIGRLWEEKPQKYSRALLETLAIIAYRQPITRGDIEKIRGVAVSTNITRTLLDREWIRVVGHRDVPGRPAMYATTRQFLDYFNLESLEQLPALAEIRDMVEVNGELSLNEEEQHQSRVLELPSEEEQAREQEARPEDAPELLAEEEAAALAARPLDEILAYGREEEADESGEQEGNEDGEEERQGDSSASDH